MIDKELKVGDCISLSYSTLADIAEDMKENGVSESRTPDYQQFVNDTDAGGNVYFVILEIAPWGVVTLYEMDNSNGMITLGEDIVKKYGVFVIHKEVEVKETLNSRGKAVASTVTFANEELEHHPTIEARIAEKEMAHSEIAEKTKQDDKVSHPSHYTWLKELCGVEVIDITRHLDFDMGNALKYLLRAGKKSEEGYSDKEKEIEDLKKAVFYIQDKIKMLEEEDERD